MRIEKIVFLKLAGLFFLCFTVFSGYSAFAATTTVNVSSSADNWIDKGGVTATSTPSGGDESWNKGGMTPLGVGLTNAANKIHRSLIEFDLTSIPTNAYIASSTMRLYCSFKWPVDTANTIHAYKLLRDWTEGTSADGTYLRNVDSTWWHADYEVQWGTQGADLVGTDRTSESLGSVSISTGCMSGTGAVADGVASQHNWQLTTTTIQSWAQDSSSNYGMILIGNEVTGQLEHQFASRETSTAAFRPSLMVQYDLIPGTPASLGGSLGVANGSYISSSTPNLPFTQADDDGADTLQY
ncbi:MAG: DNRLRE domain-containing protein, partial [Patescibacteria group bacterium]